MKKYETRAIRNVCLLAHGGVGKTTMAEAICYTSKATHKLGKVDNGSSIFDARSDEKSRNMTISLAAGFCEWKNHKINVLDTPGFLDLQAEAKSAIHVCESGLLMIDAADGLQVGTEIMSRFVDEAKLPKILIVTGLDKENADYKKCLENLKQEFGTSVAPLILPLGSGGSLKGMVNLMTMQAFEYDREGNGMGKKIDIPADAASEVEELRSALMEAVAESNEDLMNKYFEEGEISAEEMRAGLSRGVAEGMIYPLIACCGKLNMGTDLLLDAIVELCPSPLARKEVDVKEPDEIKSVACNSQDSTMAFCFKTISEEHVGEMNLVRVFNGSLATGQEYTNPDKDGTERIGNMYFVRGREKVDTNEISTGDIGALIKLKDFHTNNSLVTKGIKYSCKKIDIPEPLVSIAVRPNSKDDEEKIGIGFTKLNEEDASFTYIFHPDLHQSILSAMGDVHIDILLGQLKDRFKVEVSKQKPKISYRETITGSAKYVEYTHKKQTGGAGQYARVFIDMEPMERGGGYEFTDKIVGGVIDQSLRPSVDKGIRAKLESGIVAGYPIVDVRVTLVDGKMHPVDSKDIAFQIAGREVFKKAFEMSNPILLEPIADLNVTVPDEYTGDIMGDLSSRRGKIGGMEPQGKYQTISAKVPESEIQTYSQTLRSLSQGRGYYTKKFSHYDPMPPDFARKIIEQSQQENESAA